MSGSSLTWLLCTVLLATLLAESMSLADPMRSPCGVARISSGPVWPVSCPSCPEGITLATSVRVLRRNAAGGEQETSWVGVGDAQLAGEAAIRFGRCAPLALRAVEQGLVELELGDESDLAAARQRIRDQLAHQMPYHFASEARLAPSVELQIHQLGLRFRRFGGRRRLLVTSGIRGPYRQARAMFIKLLLGSRLVRLYRRRKAAREIVRAYRAARRQRWPRVRVIAAMQAVIEAQICRGIYISEHLKAGAVDLRSIGLRWRDKRALRRAARSFGRALYLKEERRPPHFHLAFRRLGRTPPRPAFCADAPARARAALAALLVPPKTKKARRRGRRRAPAARRAAGRRPAAKGSR